MATLITKGSNLQVTNLSITATGDTQVGFDQPVNGVTIQCRTAVDLQLRTSQSSPNFFTIKSGTIFSLDLFSNITLNATQSMPLWLRSGSGTVNVEVIGYFGN